MNVEEKRYIVLLIVLLAIAAGVSVSVGTGRLSVLSGMILVPILAGPTAFVLANLSRIVLKNRSSVNEGR